MKKKALFVTLEGLEGSGKSSVITYLKQYFKKHELSVVLFREPGSTQTGEKIRKLLLKKGNKISPHTELLLYLAARTQLIEEELQTALGKYDVVLCDRFYDSTIVYQGYGLKLGSIVNKAAKEFALGIKPDLTLILDSDIKKSLGRIKVKDRIESRALDFHSRLKKGFRQIAAQEPRRIKLIDATKTLPEVYSAVEAIVKTCLIKRKIIQK
jgi:dTMP kinase